MMSKMNGWLPFFIVLVLTCTGCAPAIFAGSAAFSAGTGTYFFVNGELKTDYHASFENVWKSCEKVIADMHSVDVIPYKQLSEGTIDAIIDEEKVHFSVTYKSKNLTTVGIRVGMLGNQLASQRLHDKVADQLTKDIL